MASLPVDHRGFAVPFFVGWVDAETPDHRTADPLKRKRCVEEGRCWLCGDKLGRYLACVIGPMCAVNRNTSEPPSHTECALYAVQTCPFLTRPSARRRTAGLPDEVTDAAGIPLDRNPGVALVWITRTIQPYRDPVAGGLLFRVGDPVETLWFCEGRPATRAEVQTSFETGLPILYAYARQERGGVPYLERQIVRAMRLLPKESS
jgi:hypothetical protein